VDEKVKKILRWGKNRKICGLFAVYKSIIFRFYGQNEQHSFTT